jgi:hypothetical protein
MLKISFTAFFSIVLLGAVKYFTVTEPVIKAHPAAVHHTALKQTGQQNWPDGLTVTPFSGPDLTPSPACLATAPTGEVYVGVDMMGSLGKAPGKGMILSLVDKDNDGKIDGHTEFAA